MKKLAIIGASYLQAPLIETAKSMGLETHVFAWAANDVGEKIADYFYPISIVEKEEILNKCQEIGIDGICSIASDLAIITVNYVAQKMGLPSNDMKATLVSTNKHEMRKCFENNGDPSPKSKIVSSIEDIDVNEWALPLIVKPLDRSGSRGITKINDFSSLSSAIEEAKKVGFDKHALVEEFIEGDEYSVEYLSDCGTHHFLTITKKYTTGAPNFIETAHIEPSDLSEEMVTKVKLVVEHALNSLGLKYGASHSEVKINNGEIKIVEIGGRMGGDFIGSDLVKLSTGFNFVREVINVAIGVKSKLDYPRLNKCAAVRFIFNQHDLDVLELIKKEVPEIIVNYEYYGNLTCEVTDSSNRHGYYLLCSDDRETVKKYIEM